MTESDELTEITPAMPIVPREGVAATHSSQILSREESLVLASRALKQIANRCSCKRHVPGAHDKERLQWARALTSLLGTYNQVLQSQEVDEIGRRLELIETRLTGNR